MKHEIYEYFTYNIKLQTAFYLSRSEKVTSHSQMVTLLGAISNDILVYIITFLGVVMCESFGKTCMRVLGCCHGTYVDSDIDFYMELMNHLVSIGLNFHVYGGYLRSLIGRLMPNDLDIFIEKKRDSTRAILHLTSLSIFCPTIKKSWYNKKQEMTHKSVVFNFGGKQKKIDICFCASRLSFFKFDLCVHISQNFDFDVNSLHVLVNEFIYKPYSQFISRCENVNNVITDLIKKKQCNANYEMLQYGTNTEKRKICGSRMRKMVVDHGYEITNMTDEDIFHEVNEYNNYVENRPHARRILMFVICSMNFLVDTFFDDLKKIKDEMYMNMRKLIDDEAMAVLSKSICTYCADYLEKANNQKNIYHRMYMNMQKLINDDGIALLDESIYTRADATKDYFDKKCSSVCAYWTVLGHCYNTWSQINGEDISGFLCGIYEDIQWNNYKKMVRQMCTKTKCIKRETGFVYIPPEKLEENKVKAKHSSATSITTEKGFLKKNYVKKPRNVTTIVYFFGFERKGRKRNDYDKKMNGNKKDDVRREIHKENKRNNNKDDGNYHPTKHFRRKELLKSCKDL